MKYWNKLFCINFVLNQYKNIFATKQMKNSLQLQLQNKIKKANRFLIAKQYGQAVCQYSEGIQLYQQNRRYNQCISTQFQSILYSLRGNCNSLNMKSDQAESDFQKSLSVNPYNSVTLSRRAKHFMKQKRYSEAIQDIDMALLYDPENINYMSLLNSIQNFVNDIKNPQEKSQITGLITQVKNRLQAKPPTQSESEEEDQQEILKFSNLKLIDRESVRITPAKLGSFQRRKSNIQFKQDQIVEYQSQNVGQENQENVAYPSKIPAQEIDLKLSQQQEELKELQVEEEQIRKSQVKIPQQIVLTKSQPFSRKSILRKQTIGDQQNTLLFISSPGQKLNLSQRSSISAASIKDIDGKVASHQVENIKFKPRPSLFSNFEKGFQQTVLNDRQNLNKTTPNLGQGKTRKSCLTASIKFSKDEDDFLSKTTPVKHNQTVKLLKRKSSNFENIKSIDGQYHKKQEGSYSPTTPINVQIDSQSDDDNNEHDIFGSVKHKQVIQVWDDNQQIPEKISQRLSKKKSILRKDSFIGSSMASSTWKMEKKKSVLFRTQ